VHRAQEVESAEQLGPRFLMKAHLSDAPELVVFFINRCNYIIPDIFH
jgi:hypothetical protein